MKKVTFAAKPSRRHAVCLRGRLGVRPADAARARQTADHRHPAQPAPAGEDRLRPGRRRHRRRGPRCSSTVGSPPIRRVRTTNPTTRKHRKQASREHDFTDESRRRRGRGVSKPGPENGSGRLTLTRHQQKLLDASVAIRAAPPGRIDFLHSIQCQCGIPYKNPGDGVREWDRQQGNASLRIEAGFGHRPADRGLRPARPALRGEAPAGADPPGDRGGPHRLARWWTWRSR